MDTYKISVILRAIELGSLTKAAAEYEYSPSALSQMLTSLEEEIGTTLITRTHTGITAAEGAEDIISMLGEMLKIKDEIISAAAKSGNRAITVATYPSISKNILPSAIKAYKQLHADVDINIIVSDTFDDIFRKGLADFCFGERIKSDEAVFVPVLDDPFLAVLPVSYKCEGPEISCLELLKNKFIKPKDKNISAYIKKYSTDKLLSHNASDDSSVMELVRAEMGVSILSRMATLGAAGIKTEALSPPLYRRLGFIYKRSLESSNKRAMDLMNFLAEHVKTEKL